RAPRLFRCRSAARRARLDLSRSPLRRRRRRVVHARDLCVAARAEEPGPTKWGCEQSRVDARGRQTGPRSSKAEQVAATVVHYNTSHFTSDESVSPPDARTLRDHNRNAIVARAAAECGAAPATQISRETSNAIDVFVVHNYNVHGGLAERRPR